MKKSKKTKFLAALLAGTMVASMITGCGGDSKEKEEEVSLKECVYSFDKLPCSDQVKGDINTFKVAGDKIYIYSSEWIEGENGESDEAAATETEETGGGETSTKEETETEGTEAEEAETEDAEAAEESGETEKESSEEAEDVNAEAAEGTKEESSEAAEDEYDEKIMGTMNNYFYVCNADGTDLKELFSVTDNGSDSYLQQFDVADNGDICLVYSNYTEEKTTYEIRIVDGEGKEKSSTDINDILGDDYLNTMRMDGEGNLYLLGDQGVYVLDSQGKKLFDIKTEQGGYAMAVTKDGKVLTTEWGDEGISIIPIDFQNKKLGEKYDNVMSNMYSSESLMDGAVYDFYVNDNSAVYGYDSEKGKMKKLLDWTSSNINANNISKVAALENGDFVASYYDYTNGELAECGLYLLKKVDPSQVVDKQQITYAGVWVNDAIRSQAVKFNKSQDKYQIVVKDYSDAEDPYEKMNADLVAGNVPDIIDLAGLSVKKYIAKGMLEDLYPYMEKDDEIKKEDFDENILQVMETDTKLYHISPCYTITTLVGSKKDIAGRDHLTLQDIKDLEESYGADTKAFNAYSNIGMLYSICDSNYDAYIDWETGTCHFEDSDFGDLLEYCATYPKEEDITEESMEEEESLPSKIKNKKILFADLYSASMEEVELYSAMFDDEIGFIGYPSDEKNGAGISLGMDLGICSKSSNKEGAWEFIRSMLTAEYASDSMADYYSGMPLRKDSMEAMIKAKSATEEYKDEFGNTVTPLDSTWGFDDLEVQIKPLTEEQVAMVRELIASVDHISYPQDEAMQIVQEEAESYFNGQKSKEEVVKIIQNRVTTYVNENK